MGDAPVFIPDAGPWITLACADALDLLLKPSWPLAIVDMVLEELTRSQTPTSQQIASWVSDPHPADRGVPQGGRAPPTPSG
jgi:hypothetical protein